MLTENPQDEALEALFEDSTRESLKVTLPSKGLGYNGHPGTVTIRAMDYSDEKELANIKTGDDLVDTLIERCVDSIEPDILYLPDKLFILYKLREVSFGSVVTMDTYCSKCSHPNVLEIDLSQLPIEYAEEGFSGRATIDLPVLNKPVRLRLPRSKDATYFRNKESTLDSLWRFVESIGDVEDPVVITAAIKKLTSADLKVIIGSLNIESFGIQTKAKYFCSKDGCGAENVSVIPITQDFFTLN